MLEKGELLLRDKLRNLFFALIYFTGIHIVYRWLFQKNKVTILLFHEISSLYSRKIFKYLNTNYNIISLRDYVDFINNKNKNINFSTIKNKLIITIDDGHKSNFNLFNTIKDMNLPMTIFLTTGIVGTKNGFWWNNNNSNHKNETLKKLPDNERLEILNSYGFKHEYELVDREALSYEEILAIPTIGGRDITKCGDAPIVSSVNDSPAVGLGLKLEKSTSEFYLSI